MESGKARLEVCMLGGFTIRCDGRPVSFNKGGRFKSISLLQLLFIHKDKGISKEELLQCLYDWEAINDRNNSLNSLIYRLKKQLIAAGLPQDEYISLKNGICRWSADIETKIDFITMEELIAKAEGKGDAESEALLEEACALYQGEFLPESSNEIWVAVESVRLKGLYEEAVLRLCSIWEKQGEYQKMLDLYTKTAELYPYEEWQGYQIDCLLDLCQYEKAYELYRRTVKNYADELGIPPSDRLLERLQRMNGKLITEENSLSKVREQLRENEAKGAYYCPYPSFIDTYRYVCRIVERSGQSLFLMLCTLRYTDLSSEKDSDAQAHLQYAIERSLRRGDVYTKYSSNQCLILLSEIQREGCDVVFHRINTNFRKINRDHNCRIEYEAAEIMDFEES